ncbi:prephenate dehydrogenase [Sinimarinibacterium flocculans]|uniref:Prephenate dehydrogenase n=1 Tax=Sinimarinibacterium flocculans TaxID=985250 RepID=A0A318EHW9_9GAMM|nr:prephenate dehydrogenase/arogenate dehydrogenase family protein [Sinimarinibacterium flocculans]PXV71530.1 prephenate dehydrogenase [Sinimarinibacterium flocculans]
MIVQRLAVIGLGLIGGSLARALRSAGAVAHISGYDPDPSRRDDAQRLCVIDRVCDTPAAAVRDADLVVLAVPVLHTVEALVDCLPACKLEVVVTDVGSTKSSVLGDVARACGELPPWFVAGHPIAGTEKSGIAHSQADLFRRHRVILTPHEHQDRTALALVTRVWQAAGARVVEMDARRHDAIFAATSHLPHVLAYSFVDMLARLDGSDEIFPNAGGGFRDFSRIASSSPEMWHDIVRANAASVGELLDRQIGELQQIRAMMHEARWDELKALFERARSARERYLAQIE